MEYELPQLELRSPVLLLSVLKDIQFGVNCYRPLYFTTFNTEHLITYLRIIQFSVRSAVLLTYVFQKFQYVVKYYCPTASKMCGSE